MPVVYPDTSSIVVVQFIAFDGSASDSAWDISILPTQPVATGGEEGK